MNNNIKDLFKGLFLPLSIWFVCQIIVQTIFVVFNVDVNLLYIVTVANAIAIIFLFFLYKKIARETKTFVSLRYIVLILGLSIALATLFNIVISKIGDANANVASREIAKLLDETNIYVVSFMTCILAPVAEELVFRGVMFVYLSRVFNKFVVILITSLLFAVVHGELWVGIYAFCMGIFLGFIRYKFDSVFFSILMHLFINMTPLFVLPPNIENMDIRNSLFYIFISIAIATICTYRIATFDRQD